MLAVVDTNVWVSAFLSPAGPPAKMLGLFLDGQLVPLCSPEIESEYRLVLARPKFRIDPETLALFFVLLRDGGRFVATMSPPSVSLPDPKDWPFIAAARLAGCPVVTGNLRHFPPEAEVEAMSPGEWVRRFMT